jgi:hypothetical protein
VIRARLSLGLVATFVGLLAILHFLEPEFNSGHLISEYQLSRRGSMMSSAFCSLGIGVMLLAHVIPPYLPTRSGRLGRRGLWLIGAALFAAGLFPPIRTTPIVAHVHGVSGLAVILGAPVVFLLASRSLAHEPVWSRTARHLRWATALAGIGILSFLGFTVALRRLRRGRLGYGSPFGHRNHQLRDDHDVLCVVGSCRMGTSAARILSRMI